MSTEPKQYPDNYFKLIQFYKFFTYQNPEVTNHIFPNDVVAWVSWIYSEDNVAGGKILKLHMLLRDEVSTAKTIQAPK